MLVLVTYDVNITSAGGQKRLRRVAKVCTDYGVRVQNSVFECVVDNTEYVRMKAAVLKVIDEQLDSIRFYRLGNNYDNKVEHYGVSNAIEVEKPLIF